MMAPILGELQNIKILKVDVSGDNKELAMKYGFSAVPTLIFFKGGTEVYRTTGFVKKVDLQNKIDELNVTEIS
jgi:thiol:disulfide interchange protein